MLHALLLTAVLAADPDVEAMRAELQSRIALYERLNDLEDRVTDLEQKGGDPVVVPNSGATGPLPTDQVAPEFAPTSHEAIQFALSMYRGVRPEHTFIDIGCGDGRVLIAAVQKWGCHGLGIEIDPEQAELARRCVEAAGLSDRIEIVEGDATQMDPDDLKANAGFAFLYPETLEALADVIDRIPAFVSYQHPVAGLKETRSEHGKFYSRDPQPQFQVVADRPYAVWKGVTYYGEYNPGCTCEMCGSIRHQLSIPRTKTVAVQPEQPIAKLHKESKGTGSFQWMCVNGQCGWYWVE